MRKESRPALGRYHGQRITVQGFISIVEPSKLGRGWRACLRSPCFDGECLADHVWLILRDHPGQFRDAHVSAVVVAYDHKIQGKGSRQRAATQTVRFGLDKPVVVG